MEVSEAHEDIGCDGPKDSNSIAKTPETTISPLSTDVAEGDAETAAQIQIREAEEVEMWSGEE
eukprot:12485880-Alexandrium_andersonii.AAC.1